MAFLRFNNTKVVGMSAEILKHVKPAESTTDQYVA